jgi:hypothetical protein
MKKGRCHPLESFFVGINVLKQEHLSKLRYGHLLFSSGAMEKLLHNQLGTVAAGRSID